MQDPAIVSCLVAARAALLLQKKQPSIRVSLEQLVRSRQPDDASTDNRDLLAHLLTDYKKPCLDG
jgi:hypothetical protein